MDLLLSPGLAPFVSAAGLVVLFLILELALTAMGIDTWLGAEAPALEADLGLDADLPGDLAADLAPDATPAPQGGALGLLGLRDLPLTAWLAFLAAGFAAGGFALQAAARALTGGFLPATLAALVALPAALILTGALSRTLARLFPRETTSAISERSYGRRRGVVTVGTARAGQPAQVRFTDGHGNLHYLMAEPFDPKDEIGQGSEVLILKLRDASLRIVKIA